MVYLVPADEHRQIQPSFRSDGPPRSLRVMSNDDFNIEVWTGSASRTDVLGGTHLWCSDLAADMIFAVVVMAGTMSQQVLRE